MFVAGQGDNSEIREDPSDVLMKDCSKLAEL